MNKSEINRIAGELLAGASALAVASGLWYLIIWGAVEGWKYVGR